MNQVIIDGVVYGTPEVRKVGQATVTGFAVINKCGKTKDGKAKTYLFNCEAWGDTGKEVASLQSGKQVCVAGTLTRNDWEDKNTGEKKHNVKIRVSTLAYAELGDNSQPQAQQPQPQANYGYSQAPAQQQAPAYVAEGAPF